jgi:sulfur relay (sulfurtransferase) complex TusBCD TusD component (DsrE family)
MKRIIHCVGQMQGLFEMLNQVVHFCSHCALRVGVIGSKSVDWIQDRDINKLSGYIPPCARK